MSPPFTRNRGLARLSSFGDVDDACMPMAMPALHDPLRHVTALRQLRFSEAGTVARKIRDVFQ
jgi:hypothetical protein